LTILRILSQKFTGELRVGVLGLTFMLIFQDIVPKKIPVFLRLNLGQAEEGQRQLLALSGTPN
jgi:hypothetical protein